MTRIICGVDASRARLDAHFLPEGRSAGFDNTAEGAGDLIAAARAAGVELVIVEASGGVERRLVAMAHDDGLGVARVNPRFVRRFAESLGRLEKTDRIDAELIARFADVAHVVPAPPPRPGQGRLTRMVARLGQITRDLTVQKQRLAAVDDDDDETRDSLCRTIACLRAEASRFDGEIASAIDDDPEWRPLADALREVKGVAGRTVARLLAEFPEIGTLSGKAIAKLTGLAPIADDSGARTGRRRIAGGRAGVRSILWLIGGLAARHEPKFAAFRKRLIDAGKPIMVVRVALARKLIVILNAKARDARAELKNAT